MLIIAYGIPKTGSTLTFELLRAMLITKGFSQDLDSMDRRIVEPLDARAKRNFYGEMSRADIETLLAKIGPKDRIAVKTHAWFDVKPYSWLDALCEKREVQIIASYRDPRDICLSLVDAANRARDAGAQAFSNVRDLAHATKKVKRRVNDFRIWGSFANTVRVDYNEVAFNPTKTLDALERALDLVCDREEVLRYAFKEAITLKNKAAPHRHEDELDDAQRGVLDDQFRGFLRRVMGSEDTEWFDKMRERMLARGKKNHPPP